MLRYTIEIFDQGSETAVGLYRMHDDADNPNLKLVQSWKGTDLAPLLEAACLRLRTLESARRNGTSEPELAEAHNLVRAHLEDDTRGGEG